MVERRVTRVLEEWRELERRLAAGVRPDEQDGLSRRVAELRAEYHRLSGPIAGAGDRAAPPLDPGVPDPGVPDPGVGPGGGALR